MDFRSLVPWNRNTPAAYASVHSLQDEINRVFDDMWRGFGAPLAGRDAGHWPSVELNETEKAVEVSFELPGLSEKDVELSLEGDVLTVKGEKREEKSDKKTGYSERSYGSFERSVALPAGLVSEKADATFRDGILTVVVPKSEKALAKSRKIAIAKH